MKKYNLEKIFFVGLAGYILLHFVLRLVISSALEKDEAEMILLLNQGFSLGYNSQPPLYCWLQLIFFKLFGPSIFSLAIFKNILLFSFYFFLYKSSKIVLKDSVLSIFSTLSLLLVYNFSWIMHKDLTHSVLLIAMCSLTFFVLLKVLKTRKVAYYILLGVCVGLGLLTKYNYVLFFLVLLFSCALIKDYRKIIFNKRSLSLIILAVAICAPHYFWCLENSDILFSDIGDFKLNNKAFTFGVKGVLGFLENAFLLSIPLAVFFAIFFPKAFCRQKPDKNLKNNFKLYLELFFIISFALSLLIIICFDVGQVKPRWVQPLFFLLPLYFFIRASRVTLNRKKKIVFISLIIFCAVGTVSSVWGRIILAETRGRYNRLNFPFPQIAEKIKKDEKFTGGLILAENNVLGANLKLVFQDSIVLTPLNHQSNKTNNSFNEILVIWESNPDIIGTPGVMDELLKAYDLNLKDKTVHRKQALYRYSKDDYYELAMIIIDKQT